MSLTRSLISDFVNREGFQKVEIKDFWRWTVLVLVQFESEVEEAIRAKQESLSFTVRKWLCALAYNLIPASLRVRD